MFSATLRVALAPSVKVGALLAGDPVLPVPDGDHSLGVSPFSARTCTWYLVATFRPVIGALVPLTFCGPSMKSPLSPGRYCRS